MNTITLGELWEGCQAAVKSLRAGEHIDLEPYRRACNQGLDSGFLCRMTKMQVPDLTREEWQHIDNLLIQEKAYKE